MEVGNVKVNVEIQYDFFNVSSQDIERLVKEDLKEKNVKIRDIENLNIYYKLDEKAIYYVATLKGKKIVGTGNTPLYIY